MTEHKRAFVEKREQNLIEPLTLMSSLLSISNPLMLSYQLLTHTFVQRKTDRNIK